jgi:multidrug efflux system membrane fusion protein
MHATTRSRILPLLPLAFAALASITGCRPPAPAPPSPQAVKVALVERAVAASARRYSAHIEAASRVELAFKVGGYVDSVAKLAGVDGLPRTLQEGDLVEAGRELASIRRTDYAQKLAEAEAAFAQAKAGADQAVLDEGRAAKLAERNSIAAAELDGARTKLASANAVLAGAKARVDEAKTALADTSLRAPMAGVVVRRSVEVGSLAAPGTIAFAIADVRSVKAVFGVPDTALASVHLGAAQTVTSDAFAGVELRGRITRIAPSADPKSRVFEAEVLIPNADDRLKIGMVVALSLGDGEARTTPSGAPAPSKLDTPLVPLSAIVRPAPGASSFAVFVVDDAPSGPKGRGVAHARIVELGDYLGRVIPVRSGLVGGERIVVQGAGLLSDGELVEVVP